MKVIGFNRVELIVAEDEIDAAIAQFNRALGLHLPAARRISGQPALSATDLDGGVEFVAPVNGEGNFATKLAKNGPGQIGPLVFEVEDIEETRAWLDAEGFIIRYEYDSVAEGAPVSAPRVHQLVLDPQQWFGFSVTLMMRVPPHS